MHIDPFLDYPRRNRDRDGWVLAQRPARRPLDPRQPHACFLEEERNASGAIVRVATLFLVNRECPWHCVMCDLWQYAVADTVPAGTIPAQIDFAFARLGVRRDGPGAAEDAPGGGEAVRQVNLYNAGSFFDPRAIPPADYEAIAARVRGFDRVIVECHPALVGAR